ncbi:MAG TPA: hypothetical protein VJU87_02585, partial [Gemmatimonadaceae bacterium]|nr:hypothetical protein [Gemmatimonadaceae bacterium]
PGGRGATRLAMSSWEVWQPILAHAPEATVTALLALERSAAAIRVALERRDWKALESDWEAARRWRTTLETGVSE